MALGVMARDLLLVPGSGARSRWYLPYGGLSSGRSLQARLYKIRGRRQGLFSEAEDGVREEYSVGYGERVAGGAGRGQTSQGPLRLVKSSDLTLRIPVGGFHEEGQRLVGRQLITLACQEKEKNNVGTDGQGAPSQAEGSAPTWRWEALSKLVLIKLSFLESGKEVVSRKVFSESPATQ